MWGSTDLITPDDSIQAGLGDCWLIATMASIAEDPDRIKDIFLVEETNEVGVYAFQMYLLGMPVTITIDDYLPYNQWGEDLKYSQYSEDSAVWTPLLEKAAAKYLGNFEAINGGTEDSVHQMFGTPYT